MTCAAARARILEAELAELEATSDSELSRHLRTCPRCRAAAELIRAAERALGNALAATTPRPSLAEALKNARRAAAQRAARRWMLRLAPLATAAALAAVLFGRPADVATPPPPPPAHPRPLGSDQQIAVDTPPGRSVAVFETDNPNIIVIWYF